MAAFFFSIKSMNRYITLLLLISILFVSCKTNKVNSKEIKKEVSAPILKETLFIRMERTPCLGKCPMYTLQIFNTGNVSYIGKNFVDKVGTYSMKLTNAELELIKSKLKEIDFFNLKDKYDRNVTDVPACYLSVILDDKKKKVIDRVDGPKKLKELEKLIDKIVLGGDLIKVEK